MSTPFTPADFRRLGRTELRVSPVGLGGAFLGRRPDGSYDDGLAADTLQQALDLGINLVDTSPLYGESERRIGLGLRRWFAAGGRRADLVLCTKTGTRVRPGNYTGAHTRDSVQQSLELLGVDYLDLVHVHDPDDLTPVVAPGAALDTLAALQADGVLRHIGLGTRQHAFHARLQAERRIAVSLTYGDFHLLRQTARAGVLQPALAADGGVLLASVLLYGVLGGGDPGHAVATSRSARSLTDAAELARAVSLHAWCGARGIDLLALNLQYCLREPGCSAVLMGASEPAQIAADVAAAQAPLPTGIWDELRLDFEL